MPNYYVGTWHLFAVILFQFSCKWFCYQNLVVTKELRFFHFFCTMRGFASYFSQGIANVRVKRILEASKAAYSYNCFGHLELSMHVSFGHLPPYFYRQAAEVVVKKYRKTIKHVQFCRFANCEQSSLYMFTERNHGF